MNSFIRLMKGILNIKIGYKLWKHGYFQWTIRNWNVYLKIYIANIKQISPIYSVWLRAYFEKSWDTLIVIFNGEFHHFILSAVHCFRFTPHFFFEFFNSLCVTNFKKRILLRVKFISLKLETVENIITWSSNNFNSIYSYSISFYIFFGMLKCQDSRWKIITGFLVDLSFYCWLGVDCGFNSYKFVQFAQ